jgi:DNA-binding transcriptional regulator YiaG
MMLAPDQIRQPVDLARVLARNGVSLRKAHDALNRLTAGGTVALEMHTTDKKGLVSELRQAGVRAAFIEYPHTDAKRVRESLGYSQYEFALRYGIEIDTLQNWEQQRYEPDQPMQLLLKIIETNPELLERVVTTAPSTAKARRKVSSDTKAD